MKKSTTYYPGRKASASLMHKALLSALLTAGVSSAHALPSVPQNVPVISLPGIVFKSPDEINGWIQTDNKARMKRHAWELFAAAMTPLYSNFDAATNTDATVRLFDTWHSLNEVVPAINSSVIDFNALNLTRPAEQLQTLDVPTQTAHNDPFSPQIMRARTVRDFLTFSEASVSDVKYNTKIGKWVENQLMNTAVDSSGQTVVTSYNLSSQVVSGEAAALQFNDAKGVMLKPAYTIVKAAGPTIIGRWEESINTVNPQSINSIQAPVNADTRVASERTWVQQAVVFPPNTENLPDPTYYGRDGTPIATPADIASLPTYTMADFHFVKLTQAMVDSLRYGILGELMGPNIDNIAVGDYAVLTSMHIATREIDNWTWQTFWWQPIADETLAQNGAPWYLRTLFDNVSSYQPLKHFRAGVGYSYNTPNGEPVICSNPYLEGSFGLPADLAAVFGANAAIDGVNIFLRDAGDVPIPDYVHEGNGLKTNCVTCHKAAAYPANSVGNLPTGTQGIYPDYGLLNGTEDLFIGRLQTHFLWGVANKVTAREAAVAP